MKITTTLNQNTKITIEELNNSVFCVLIEIGNKLSISHNGFHSLKECLEYADKTIKDLNDILS